MNSSIDTLITPDYSFSLIFFIFVITSLACYAHFSFGYSISLKYKNKWDGLFYILSLISIVFAIWLAPSLVYLARNIPYLNIHAFMAQEYIRLGAVTLSGILIMSFVKLSLNNLQLLAVAILTSTVIVINQAWVDYYHANYSIGFKQLAPGLIFSMSATAALLLAQRYFRHKKMLRRARGQIILSALFGMDIALTSMIVNKFAYTNMEIASAASEHKTAILSIAFLAILFIFAFVRALYVEEKRSPRKAKFPIMLLSLSFLLTITLVTWSSLSNYETYKTVTEGIETRTFLEKSLEDMGTKQELATESLLLFLKTKKIDDLTPYYENKSSMGLLLYGLKKNYPDVDVLQNLDLNISELQRLEDDIMISTAQERKVDNDDLTHYVQKESDFKITLHNVVDDSNMRENSHLSNLSDKILITLFLTIISSALVISAWYYALRSVKRWLKKLELARGELSQKILEKEQVESRLNSYIEQVRSAHILVVDDHPINLLFMRKALQKLNFTNVDEAHSGLEAVRMFEKKEYALILMDCQMPEMDGYEASMHIRLEASIRESYPVIVAITADAMKGAKEKCLEAGMDDYISKPIDIGKMQSVLAKWLGNKSLDTDSHEDENTQETALMDFTRLTLYSDGDESEIKYMIDLFMDCADECLQILISGEEDQQQSWKKAAHRLKGSAANFGATQLSDYCEEAESYSHNDSAQRTILAQRIKENYDEVLMALFRQYP